MISDNIIVSAAEFTDQGKIADYLIKTFGDILEAEASRAKLNGMPELDIREELLAADDFYFSNVELMDCCLLAKDQEEIVGLCCVNPFTATLQYLAVNQSWRRQGIGSRLLSLGKKVISKRGGTHLKLELPSDLASAETLAFFEKNKLAEVKRSILLSGVVY